MNKEPIEKQSLEDMAEALRRKKYKSLEGLEKPVPDELVILTNVCDYLYDSNLDKDIANLGLNEVHDYLFALYWRLRMQIEAAGGLMGQMPRVDNFFSSVLRKQPKLPQEKEDWFKAKEAGFDYGSQLQQEADTKFIQEQELARLLREERVSGVYIGNSFFLHSSLRDDTGGYWKSYIPSRVLETLGIVPQRGKTYILKVLEVGKDKK